MYKCHPKPFDCPYCKEQFGERKLSVYSGNNMGRSNRAHDEKSEESNGKTGGNGPFAADFIGNRTSRGKTDNTRQTADDGEDHRCTGDRLQIVNHIVADIGPNRIIRHKPEKLSCQDSKQHLFVCRGHRLVVFNRIFYRGITFTLCHLIFDLICYFVLPDGKEQYQRRDYHEEGCNDERQLNRPDITGFVCRINVIAQLEENTKNSCKGTAQIPHDIDDSVCLCT